MDFFRNFLDSVLPAKEWSITFSGLQEPWLRALLLAVALSVLLFSWMGLRTFPWGKGLLIMLLRTLATLALVFMTLEPQVELKDTARIRNKVALILDNSKSMSIKAEGEGRFEGIKRFLLGNKAFLELLERDFDLDFLSFSDQVKEVSRRVVEEGMPLEGTSTDLATMLRYIKKRYQGKPVSGFLLFSDGADTSPVPIQEKLEELEKLAGELPAPLFAFSPAPEGYKDIAITEVSSDSFAFVRNPWHIQLTIKVKGYSNLTLPVTLKEGENIILSRPLELLPGKETYIVTMKAVPYSLGSTLYTVTVPPLADELVSENNSVSVMVHVIRDKVRVLHLCGRPSWDELFLRRILKKDPSVDLISFFILRTPNDLVEASSRELSLIPFPAEELFTKVLESFDLVIFQNFDYRPYDSTFLRFAYYLANVQKFVKETGGAFLMVGGELAFAHGGYDSTPIEDILPVQLNEEQDTIDTKNFRFLLTPQGLSHPITTLEYDTERNQKTWSDLPELRGLNMISATKAGAITLGVHPQDKQPVLAVQDVGKGRTMALLTDDSWRWNFLSLGMGGSNRHYIKFWRNAVRWLIKDPDLNLVRINPQKEEYLPGEEVYLKIEVYGRDYTPLAEASLKLEVVDAETGKKVVEKDLVSDQRGQAYVSFKPSGGFYKAKVRAVKTQEELGEATTLFCVKSSKEEFREPLINEPLLKAMAQASGGGCFTLPVTDIEKKFTLENPEVIKLLGKRTFPLWDNWLFFTVIIGALASEWWIRKTGRM